MNTSQMLIVVTALFTFWFWLFCWRQLNRSNRFPLAVYSISFLATYGIGAFWIGWTECEILRRYMMNRMWIPDFEEQRMTFWMMVFTPFIVPPLVVLILQQPEEAFRIQRIRSSDEKQTNRLLGWTAFVSLFALITAYVFYVFRASGHLSLAKLETIVGSIGNTTVFYENRMSIFDQGGRAFFGLIYGTLPALCHVSLYQAIKKKSYLWRIIFAACACTVIVAGLATYQIMIPMVFLLSILVALIYLNALSMISAPLAITSVFIVLSVLQFVKRGERDFGYNLMDYVLRMPHALPYYLDCYPAQIPHTGVRLLGTFTGWLESDPNHSLVVGHYINPYNNIPSYTPAPAHVSAYADAGVFYSLIALGFVGAFISIVARVSSRASENAIQHALFIQCLVGVYYLTQITIRGVLWQSYGIIWSLIGLGVLAMISKRRYPNWNQRR